MHTSQQKNCYRPRSPVILGFIAGKSGDCSALLTLFIRDADRANIRRKQH